MVEPMLEPRIKTAPAAVDSALADEAVAFCRSQELHLDEWQEMVLRSSLQLDADGR